MKLKEKFLLTKVEDEFIAVPVGKAGKEFSGIIRFNVAGEFLWKELEKGITEEALIAKMLERYEGLDAATAKADLAEFLETIAVALEKE